MSSLVSANLGFGLGLRSAHYQDFLNQSDAAKAVDWLEIISDNYLLDGGKPLQMLDAIRRDKPMVMHGVAMSLAAPEGADMAYLKRLKILADRIEPLWISDHLCWIGSPPHQLHDLNPIPYTEEAAKRVIQSIKAAQDVLQRRLVVENVSSYLEFKDSVCSEWQFLNYIAQEADCLLLLDVNNVYVSSVNRQFDPLQYLQGLPEQRIQQIHLAGHSKQDGYIIDTHDHAVAPEVWDLYRTACQWFGNIPSMIERDDHIPALGELVEELKIARNIQASENIKRSSHAESVRLPQSDLFKSAQEQQESLSDLQNLWTLEILKRQAAEPLPFESRLKQGQRYKVYHHAYAARLSEVLADTFEKTALYMGGELFDQHAAAYARAHPPQSRSLRDFGNRFVEVLKEHYPDNPELSELAQLDWDLRHVFDSTNQSVLSMDDVAKDTEQNWLQMSSPLVPALQLRSITTNIVTIWNSIHSDEDVPPVQSLDSPTTLMVWRKGMQPHFLSLNEAQAQLIASMQSGLSIAQTCEKHQDLLAQQSTTYLQECIAHWIGNEILKSTVTKAELTTN